MFILFRDGFMLLVMGYTDDKVMPDSLIQTMHYHRWYARERMRDTVNSARDACRSATVVARLLGA